jgi:hypothetical protein
VLNRRSLQIVRFRKGSNSRGATRNGRALSLHCARSPCTRSLVLERTLLEARALGRESGRVSRIQDHRDQDCSMGDADRAASHPQFSSQEPRGCERRPQAAMLSGPRRCPTSEKPCQFRRARDEIRLFSRCEVDSVDDARNVGAELHDSSKNGHPCFGEQGNWSCSAE